MRMEDIGLNNEVLTGGKNFHIQTHYLEPSEKVVSNIFDNGKVIFTKGIELKNGTPTNEIKFRVNRLHQDMIADLELIFYISEKVKTIRHSASNNKLGIVLLKRNLFDEAINQFKKAIEIDPEFVEPYNNLGYALLKQQLYQDAIDAFSSGIKNDGGYADLHYNLGYAYFHIQKYGEAIHEFNKAIEINENYISAIFYFCIVYLKSIIDEVPDLSSSIQERLEKVKQLLINIRTKEQYSEFEYIDIILQHIDKSNFTEAIETLEKAEHELREMLDKYLENEFYLKFMFGGKGKDEEFILDYVEQLKHAIEKYPDYADLRNNLGIGYLIQCRNLFLNALEEFREAMRINPEFKKAEKNLKLAENDGKGFLILLRAILK
jgi:tetratricopeptide (TPR) repeat protein